MATFAAVAPAQVFYTGQAAYVQTFDALPASGSGYRFVDNAPAPGMEGWYAWSQTVGADDGSSAASDQYSYGRAGAADRALGSISTYGAHHVVGVRIRNAAGRTFTGFDLSYMGEQWRGGGSNTTDRLGFAYSLDAEELGTGTWTPMLALDFLAPTQDGLFAEALDGNAPDNRRLRSASVAEIAWTPGQDLWLRWTHLGTGSRHGLAVDDLRFAATPVPEPATLTALAFAGFGLVARRRKGR